ncbi:MAG: glutamate--tRNA ligase [Oscillospiraceae bacterium]|jgi:glutamyl-tRNA synthetase|nr:glutamate--tRNA ligase [Oscillospiraceae bacterium]
MDITQLLFPNELQTPQYWEEKYPKRDLEETQSVTRFAPSPTGSIHIGNLFSALIAERIAHSSDGIFYLRIEDTDKKREVEGGAEYIIKALENFSVKFDEGYAHGGEYGSYKQSERVEIYHSFAKYLLEKGLAYPCFCTAEELDELRSQQEKQGELFYGYFGKWTKCRNLSEKEIEDNIKTGKPWVLRLRSDKIGIPNEWKDGIKGKIKLTPNEQDIVLLKTDGIPTYHFAHAVDDHLMRTTHVVRGEEWLSSLPIHIQLFKALEFTPPQYCHIPTIMKSENGNKRKLSKRKDPEASLKFYEIEGYPYGAVIEYLLTIINSAFEPWRKKNPTAHYNEFPFNPKNIGNAGALFDVIKLNDVSKDYISKLSAEDVTNYVLKWAEEYNLDYYNVLTKDIEYTEKVFEIAYKSARPRKDFATFSETKDVYSYFYEDIPLQISDITKKYAEIYNHTDTKEIWYEKIKELAEQFGYASDNKAFKANPEQYKGNIGNFVAILRTAITGRENSPDLYDIMQILGEKKVIERLKDERKT